MPLSCLLSFPCVRWQAPPVFWGLNVTSWEVPLFTGIMAGAPVRRAPSSETTRGALKLADSQARETLFSCNSLMAEVFWNVAPVMDFQVSQLFRFPDCLEC